MDVIRKNRLLASILGGLVVLVVLVLLLKGGGESAPTSEVRSPPSETASATPEVAATEAPSDLGRADIPSLGCGSLLTPEAVDDALAVWDRPPAERSSLGNARGETCSDALVADNRVFVRIEPGHPSDFEVGAELIGVGGEPVAEVGDAALWFGGAQAEGGGEQGVLSVRAPTSLGDLHFRIALGRPDLEAAEQIELAKQTALVALPRFPGVGEEAAPVTPGPDLALLFDEPEADRSGVSFVDNLLAKEEAGEWTRGEGLLATLQLFSGEAEPEDVLRQAEVLRSEGTGILRMAADYLESDAAEPEVAAEITRLLEVLVHTNAELEEMAGIAPAASSRTNGGDQLIGLGTARQSADLCGHFFNGGIAQGAGVCLEWRPANVPGDIEEAKYRVFIPHPSLPQAGWREDHYDLALGALEFSARWFEDHGKMPAVNLVFSVTPTSPALATAHPFEGIPCGVVLYPAMQFVTPANFQQTVAHELAHCFQTENFPKQNFNYKITKWREEGLAEYLSNLVYPQTNFEWLMFHPWQGAQPGKTLFDLSYANGMFFQYLEGPLGIEGILGLVGSLPVKGDRATQESKLGGFGNLNQLYQQFAEAMIDGDIVDSGGGTVPFTQQYKTSVLTGPATTTLEFKPFGLGNAQFVVEECKRAHLEWDPGETIDSARPEADSDWGRIPATFPESRGDATDRIIVITAVKQTSVPLEVTEVEDIKDEPGCEDEEDGGGPVEVPTPCPLECDPSEYYWRGFGVDPE